MARIQTAFIPAYEPGTPVGARVGIRVRGLGVGVCGSVVLLFGALAEEPEEDAGKGEAEGHTNRAADDYGEVGATVAIVTTGGRGCGGGTVRSGDSLRLGKCNRP